MNTLLTDWPAQSRSVVTCKETLEKKEPEQPAETKYHTSTNYVRRRQTNNACSKACEQAHKKHTCEQRGGGASRKRVDRVAGATIRLR